MVEYRSPGVYVEETARAHTRRLPQPLRPRRSPPGDRSAPTTSFEAGIASASVSLAVTLLDAGTGDPPTDRTSDVRIAFPGLDVDPTPHRSGYYLFADPSVDSVTIFVAGGEHYRDEERTVSLGEAPVVVDVRLFVRDGTFVSGTVRDTDGASLPGVELAIPDLGASAESDRNGEFALEIHDAGDHVDPPGGTRVRIDGEDPVIDLRSDSHTDGSVAVAVETRAVNAYELVYGADGTATATPVN